MVSSFKLIYKCRDLPYICLFVGLTCRDSLTMHFSDEFTRHEAHVRKQSFSKSQLSKVFRRYIHYSRVPFRSRFTICVEASSFLFRPSSAAFWVLQQYSQTELHARAPEFFDKGRSAGHQRLKEELCESKSRFAMVLSGLSALGVTPTESLPKLRGSRGGSGGGGNPRKPSKRSTPQRERRATPKDLDEPFNSRGRFYERGGARVFKVYSHCGQVAQVFLVFCVLALST